MVISGSGPQVQCPQASRLLVGHPHLFCPGPASQGRPQTFLGNGPGLLGRSSSLLHCGFCSQDPVLGDETSSRNPGVNCSNLLLQGPAVPSSLRQQPFADGVTVHHAQLTALYTRLTSLHALLTYSLFQITFHAELTILYTGLTILYAWLTVLCTRLITLHA